MTVNIDKWEKFLKELDPKRPFCYPSMAPKELAALLAGYKDCLEYEKQVAAFSAALRDPDEDLTDEVREAFKGLFNDIFPESRGN